jgi:hypothetical protein
LIDIGPVTGPIPIDFRVFHFCRRTRAFSVVCSIVCVQGKPWTRVAYRAAAHVPLPVITMSNSVSQTIFTSKINEKRHSEPKPRSSVGAGYRGVVLPSQTGKGLFFGFFLRPWPALVEAFSPAHPSSSGVGKPPHIEQGSENEASPAGKPRKPFYNQMVS